MTSIRGVTVDLETVELLKQGDRQAQTEVYKLLSPHVYTMALRVLRDVQAAEDVTQDTFIDILTKVKTLRMPERFVGWVRTIAVNRCYMKIRSPWNKRRVAEEVPEVAVEYDLSNTIDIENVLMGLDPKTRLVVWMYCVEGYTHEEIGKMMKKSTSYSKVMISRLTQRFKTSNEDKPASKETDDVRQAGILGEWSTMLCP